MTIWRFRTPSRPSISALARTAGAARTAPRNRNHRQRRLISASASTVALAPAPTGSVCRCTGGYSGDHCNAHDLCGVSCGGHGSCVNGACVCAQGYSGSHCETPPPPPPPPPPTPQQCCTLFAMNSCSSSGEDSTNNPATTTFLAPVLRLKMRSLRRCEEFRSQPAAIVLRFRLTIVARMD